MIEPEGPGGPGAGGSVTPPVAHLPAGIRPGRGAWVAVLLVALLAAGIRDLRFDPGHAAFFDADDPQHVAYESIRTTFRASDRLLLLVEPRTGTVFTPSVLTALHALTAGAWQLPGVLRVDSLVNFQHATAHPDDPDDLAIGDLLAAVPPDAATVATVRTAALGEPELAGRLVAGDGRLAVVAVAVQPLADPLADGASLVAAARALGDRIEAAHPEVRIALSGILAMNQAFAEASFSDSARLVPLMFAAFAGLLVVVLRSLAAAAAVMLVVLLAIAAALGVAGWAGIALTSATAIVPMIIATVAIADGVHLGLGWRRQCARLPDPADRAGRAAALQAALGDHRGPIVLTSLTTVLGFLALNGSAVPPFRDLGNLAATGTAVAGALSLTLLPALLGRIRPPPEPLRERSAATALGRFVAARAGLIVALAAVAAALSPLGLARLEANDEFVTYFDERLPFRAAADLQAARMGGLYDIEFALASTAADGFADPAELAALDRFVQWLRGQPEVRHASAWSDTVRRMHRDLVDGRAVLPGDPQLAAQLRLAFELALPVGQDTAEVITRDGRSTRVQVVFGNLGSREMLALEQRIVGWLAAEAPQFDVRRGSVNLMFSHVGQRNVSAMLQSMLLAVLLVSAAMLASLRAWSLGLVALVVNLAPIALAFALWAVLVGPVNLAVSTAAAMALGVVVDSTVHLLAQYRAGLAAGMPPVAAVHAAVAGSGRAILLTGIVLTGGFAVLAGSAFTLNADLGRITVLTLLCALAFDVLVLPALLFLLARRARLPAAAPQARC